MRIKVLIADDHALVAEGLSALIREESDLEVVACIGNGREAVRMAGELAPDVVVMDLSMPELNGIDATKMIRERQPATQVLILSMYSKHEYVVRALQAGASGYLLKKATAKNLPDAIRAVHRGERFLSPQVVNDIVDNYVRGGTPAGPLDILSARERQVLQLIVEGQPTHVIAQKLNLSPKTVETYRVRVMQKLNLIDVPSLVKFAIQHGITPLE